MTIKENVFNLYEKRSRDWLKLNLKSEFYFQKSLKSSFEYLSLLRVADQIQENILGFSGRDILVKKGTPVIIHFNIPIIKLSHNELKEIYGCLNDNDSETIHECCLEESFIHKTIVNAENIVKFEKIKSVENKYNMPVY